jgi:hypothetical protein
MTDTMEPTGEAWEQKASEEEQKASEAIAGPTEKLRRLRRL